MSNELVKQAPAHSLAEFMQGVLRDPNVPADKLEALWRMRKELLHEEQREEYDAALSLLQGELKQVTKNGLIDLSGKGLIKYARWEDIDTHIRPLIAKYGFDLTFTVINRDDNKIVVRATLTRNGHSRCSDSPALPADIGPGRNGLQAAGSATSYGKRYAAEALLNIVRRGEDDDGTAAARNDAPISAEQAAQLSALVKELNETEKRFL